jgi:uncharacterized membrane protein YedE/YeeE
MIENVSHTWPWYIAGPLIGLIVPLLLVIGGKQFGISENLRHLCAMLPARAEFFRYNWRTGLWNLMLVAGILLGGFIAGTWLSNPDPEIAISDATKADLAALGIRDFRGLVPADVFSWSGLLTVPGFVMLVIGGFLVGFGAKYAGGCTSGHAISGLADLQLASLIAVIAFFAGGLFVTHFVLPVIF